jgi:hypothetical protein
MVTKVWVRIMNAILELKKPSWLSQTPAAAREIYKIPGCWEVSAPNGQILGFSWQICDKIPVLHTYRGKKSKNRKSGFELSENSEKPRRVGSAASAKRRAYRPPALELNTGAAAQPPTSRVGNYPKNPGCSPIPR